MSLSDHSAWLAAYDAKPEKRPTYQPAPKTPAQPKPDKPAVDCSIKQSNGDWIGDFKAAEDESSRLCLDITNNLNTRYLPADCLKHGDAKIVRSHHGTGKSTAVRALISDCIKADKTILIVCAGVQQAIAEQKKNPGFELYSKLAPGEIVANHVVICIDSIQRVKKAFDLVIIDECEQIAAAPLKRNLHCVKDNPQGRIHLTHHLASLISKAGKVVMLDADAGPLTDTLCHYAELDPIIIENRFKSLEGATVKQIESRGEFLQTLEDTAGVHLFCASPKDARAQSKRRKRQTTLITGKESNNKTSFIEQVSTGQHFSGDLITTTALRSGVSIDEGKHDITTVFGWLKVGKGYPPLSDQVQAMRRVRGVKRFVVYIESGALKVPLATDPKEIRAELERAAELNTKHVNQYLVSNPKDGVHLEGMTTKLHCLHQSELNRQRNDPALWITERFQELGATVTLDDAEKPLLDRIHRENQKQATESVRADDLQHAITAEIPETIDNCINDIDRHLFTCRHSLNYPEELAREATSREINKRGFIKGIQRRERETKPQAELKKEDAKKIQSRDGIEISRCSAKVAAMTQEVIGLCSHLLDGFSAADTESLLKPWLIRNASDYGKLTGSRFVCPEDIKSAGFLKKTLERYGITVTARKSNGQRVYFVDKADELNRRALEQLTGTNCISNICTSLCPLAA